MERKKNEALLDYSMRASRAKEEGEITYSEFGEAILGKDNCYSDDYLQRIHAFLKKFLPKLEEDIPRELTTTELEEKLEGQKQENFKERKKLADQRRELHKLLSSEARFEHILEAVQEGITNLPSLKFPYKQYETARVTTKEAALLLSDIHLGVKSDNQFNMYSIDIAMERLNELKNKTIHYCIEHKVTTLNVCLLGDLISGIIKTGIRVQQEEDAITQIMLISEALSELIMELQQYIPEIKVYSVYGNHSRVFPNKADGIGQENFERLIPFYLRTRLDKNIKVMDGYNDDFLMATIAGKEVFMTHGDKDSLNNVASNCVKLMGRIPDEVFMGHYHHVMTIDDSDCDIICNGSLSGTDDFAVSIRKSTKPAQVLRIYGEDIIQYKIGLE